MKYVNCKVFIIRCTWLTVVFASVVSTSNADEVAALDVEYVANIRIDDGPGLINLSESEFQNLEPATNPLNSFGRFIRAGLIADVEALKRLTGPTHEGIGLSKSLDGGFNSLSQEKIIDVESIREGFSGFGTNNIYVDKVYYVEGLNTVYLKAGEWLPEEKKVAGYFFGWRLVKEGQVWLFDDAGGRHFMSEISSILLEEIDNVRSTDQIVENFEATVLFPGVN
jgi:hypothetical protein